jgi:hypothetical protein
VKKKSNEFAFEYIRRLRDTRNQCCSLPNFDRDLADLAYSGSLDIHKEKLDSHEILDVSRLLQKALAAEINLRNLGVRKSLMRSLIILFIMYLMIKTMRAMMFTWLKLYGLTKINPVLVILQSLSVRIDEKKLNILLM